MIVATKVMFLLFILLSASVHVTAQFNLARRTKQKVDVVSSFETQPAKRHFLPGLYPDKQTTFKSSSTYRMVSASSNTFAADPYWVGSVTQQSYNKGKIGRFYYWDLQGNLRDSFLFVDIAGKNKRGLKLVFPRTKALF